jgi:hypothetical protein
VHQHHHLAALAGGARARAKPDTVASDDAKIFARAQTSSRSRIASRVPMRSITESVR